MKGFFCDQKFKNIRFEIVPCAFAKKNRQIYEQNKSS